MNYTPRGQQILALARREADHFKQSKIGNEHILLGLLRLGQGVAVETLRANGLDYAKGQEIVTNKLGPATISTNSGGPRISSIAYATEVKEMLKAAKLEAVTFGHNFVGTEHFLLSLLRIKEGMVREILHGLPIEQIYLEVWTILPTETKGPFPVRLLMEAKRLVLEQQMVNVLPEHLVLALFELGYLPKNDPLRIILKERLGVYPTSDSEKGIVPSQPCSREVTNVFLHAMRHDAARDRQPFPFGPFGLAVAIKELFPELLPMPLEEVRQRNLFWQFIGGWIKR